MNPAIELGQVNDILASLSWSQSHDRPMIADTDRKTLLRGRRLLRWKVFIDRGGPYKAKSWISSKPASDYHEIINRGVTAEGSLLRWVTYQPEVCALLTKDEHMGAQSLAHTPKGRRDLLKVNVKLYGYEDVLTVINLINDLSGRIIVPTEYLGGFYD